MVMLKTTIKLLKQEHKNKESVHRHCHTLLHCAIGEVPGKVFVESKGLEALTEALRCQLPKTPLHLLVHQVLVELINSSHHVRQAITAPYMTSIMHAMHQHVHVPFFLCRGYEALSKLAYHGQHELERTVKLRLVHILAAPLQSHQGRAHVVGQALQALEAWMARMHIPFRNESLVFVLDMMRLHPSDVVLQHHALKIISGLSKTHPHVKTAQGIAQLGGVPHLLEVLKHTPDHSEVTFLALTNLCQAFFWQVEADRPPEITRPLVDALLKSQFALPEP